MIDKIGLKTTIKELVAYRKIEPGKNEVMESAKLSGELHKLGARPGDPNMVLVGAWNKQRISSFSGIATQYRDNPQAGAATIIGAADVYVGDFNTVNIVPSRFTENASVYVIDTSTIEVKYLRPIQMQELSKTGDSQRKLLVAEYTLCVRSPDANGIILTTTTS